MADIDLTVAFQPNIDTSGLLTQVTSAIKSVEGSIPKIKVGFAIDKSQLDKIKNLATLTNTAYSSNNTSTAANTQVWSTRKINNQTKALERYIKTVNSVKDAENNFNKGVSQSAAKASQSVQKITQLTDNQQTALGKIREAMSKPNSKATEAGYQKTLDAMMKYNDLSNKLVSGSIQHTNALKKVNNQTSQIGQHLTNWSAAKGGISSESYAALEIYQNKFKKLGEALAAGKLTPEMYQKSFASLTAGVTKNNNAIKLAEENTTSFGKRVSSLAGKFSSWLTVSQGIMTAVRLGKSMYQNVANIDSAMVELKKVTNETDEAYDKFLDRSVTKSKELGSTVTDTVNATANFAKLGYGIEDAEKLSEAAILYNNVGDINDINAASESIVSTMQAFNVAPADVMSIVDKFNEVGNNYAITSEGVGEALKRSSAAMHAAGNTLDETIALTTAANRVVQDPEKIGTTLKTVSMYLRAAKTEADAAGESTEGMAGSVSELREELLSLTGGKVDIQSDDNTFKSTYDILKELSGMWSELTDVSQANILEMIGGKRNSNIVSALIENFAEAEKVLETSLGSAGSARAEHEKWLDSVEAKQLQLKASWEELSLSFLSSDFLKFSVDGLKTIVNGLNEVVETISSAGTVAAAVSIKQIPKHLKKVGDGKALAGLAKYITMIPKSAIVATAAIAGIAIAVKLTSDAIYKSKYKWAEGMSETAEEIKKHSDEITKFNALSKEVDALELIIENPASSQEQVETAKQRIQEIADLLNKDYELKITADTGEIQSALNILTAEEKQKLTDEALGLIDYVKNNKDKYKTSKESYAKNKERSEALSTLSRDNESIMSRISAIGFEWNANGIVGATEEQINDFAIIVEEYKQLHDRAKELGVEKKDVNGTDMFLDAYEDTFDWNADSVEYFWGIIQQERNYIDNLAKNASKQFDDISASITEFEESSRKAGEYLSQTLASEVALGDTYGAEASQEFLENLGQQMSEAGVDTDDITEGFAIAKQGVRDLNAAIEAGKLDNVIAEYISFKDTIGATGESAVRGAALLKQGFTDASQVTADSIDAIYKDMVELGRKKFDEQDGVAPVIENAVQGTALYAAGFNNVQEAIDAGDEGISKVLKSASKLYESNGTFRDKTSIEDRAQQLTRLGQAMKLLPDNKKVHIDIESGDLSIVLDKTEEIFQKWDGGEKKFNTIVNTEIDGEDVDDYSNKVESLNNKDCTIVFNADGSPARAVIGEAEYYLENYNDEEGTATLYADGGKAIGTIDLLTGKIDLIPERKTIELSATEAGTSGLTELALVIDELKGRGNLSFKINTDGNIEALNEAGKTIAILQEGTNLRFNIDASGDLEMINLLTGQTQTLKQNGAITIPVNYTGDMEDIHPLAVPVEFEPTEEPTEPTPITVPVKFEHINPILDSPLIPLPDTIEPLEPLDQTVNQVIGEKVDAADPDSVNQTVNQTIGSNVEEAKPSSVTQWVDQKIRFGIGWGNLTGARGTAFARGSWGASKSGTALGGELGRELVVRDGRFFTIGDNGAEFFRYKKDDIIFNAEQTKQIFEKGRITTGNRRGRALAEGNAFADGKPGLPPFVYNPLDIVEASLEIEISDITVNDKDLEESLKETLENLSSDFENAKGGLEQQIFLLDKNGGSDAEIIARYRKIQELAASQAQKYRDQGLSENSKYVQDCQKAWWDASDNILKVIEDSADKAISALKSVSDYNENLFKNAVSNGDIDAAGLYTNRIIESAKQMQEVAHNTAEYYRSLGYNEDSEEITSAQNDWWSYYEQANAAIDGYYDFIQNKGENFNKLSENWINNALVEGNYDNIRKYTNEVISEHRQMQQKLSEQADELRAQGLSDTSDEVSELSDKWWNLEEEISEAMETAYQGMVDNAKDALSEISSSHETFMDAAKEYADSGFISIDTLQNIIDLGVEYLSLLKDEDGILRINEKNVRKLTKARIDDTVATAALQYIEQIRAAYMTNDTKTLEQLTTATNDASDATKNLAYIQLAAIGLPDKIYKNALRNINALFSLGETSKGSIGETVDTIKTKTEEASEAMESLLDYTIDMIKQETEDKIEALDEQVERYREIVDLQKEALDVARERDNYEKDVSDKLKEISKIQSQIDKLSLDDSRESQAERISLQEELAELQEELSDTQADYAYEQTVDSLDKMTEAYEKQKEDEKEVLEDSISSQQKLYELAVKRIRNSGRYLVDELIDWNYEYGNNLETEITTAWDNAITALKKYEYEYEQTMEYLKGLSTDEDGGNSNPDILGDTEYGDINARAIREQMKANSLKWYTVDKDTQDDLAEANASYASQLGLTPKDGSWYCGSEKFYSIGTWEAVDYIVKAMKNNSSNWAEGRTDLESANERMASYIESLSGQKVWKDDSGVWWIGNDKLYDSYGTYHTGGIVGGNNDIKDREVLSLLERGELVLDQNKKDSAYKYIDLATYFMDKIGRAVDTSAIYSYANTPVLQDSLTSLSQIPTMSQDTNITIGDTYIYGANRDTVDEHLKITRKFTNEILDTLGVKR